jgi:hypothetical protein
VAGLVASGLFRCCSLLNLSSPGRKGRDTWLGGGEQPLDLEIRRKEREEKAPKMGLQEVEVIWDDLKKRSRYLLSPDYLSSLR